MADGARSYRQVKSSPASTILSTILLFQLELVGRRCLHEVIIIVWNATGPSLADTDGIVRLRSQASWNGIGSVTIIAKDF